MPAGCQGKASDARLPAYQREIIFPKKPTLLSQRRFDAGERSLPKITIDTFGKSR
jgi:hypothetical protein